MITIQTTAARIAGVAIAQATADVRYFLNGVHFAKRKDGGVEITATDGHRLHQISREHNTVDSYFEVEGDDERDGFIFAFPKDLLSAFAKISNRHRIVRIEANLEDTGAALVHFNESTTRVSIVDGKFPDISKVIPADETAGGAVAFQAIFLADLQKFADMLAGNKRGMVLCKLRGDSKSARFEFGAHSGNKSATYAEVDATEGALAVLMPCRA
jgi:hypothetical protein